MIGLVVFFIGMVMTFAHNTPGDIGAGIGLAAIGLLIWYGQSRSRDRP